MVQAESSTRTDTRIEHLRRSSALAFARSLFHGAEGKELFAQRFMFASAVSTYYSLFHLGSSLILAFSSHPESTSNRQESLRNKLEERWKKQQSRTLSNGGKYLPDPAERIEHDDVASFLEEELSTIGQHLGGRNSIGTLRDMREFVSYAPRMVSDGHINVLYSGCHYEASDFRARLSQHLEGIDQFSCSAIAWLRQSDNETYSRILSGDFILFEFAELRAYHPQSIANRAFDTYRSVCNQEHLNWRVWHSEPGTFYTDEPLRLEQYKETINSFQ